jgi:hypothetical protein
VEADLAGHNLLVHTLEAALGKAAQIHVSLEGRDLLGRVELERKHVEGDRRVIVVHEKVALNGPEPGLNVIVVRGHHLAAVQYKSEIVKRRSPAVQYRSEIGSSSEITEEIPQIELGIGQEQMRADQTVISREIPRKCTTQHRLAWITN